MRPQLHGRTTLGSENPRTQTIQGEGGVTDIGVGSGVRDFQQHTRQLTCIELERQRVHCDEKRRKDAEPSV